MKKKYKRFIFLFLLNPFFLHAIEPLKVEFKYKGRNHIVLGKKVSAGIYLYNQGGKKKINLTTLNWPPYIGEKICRQGWVQQLTVAIFASQGYEVTSTFYPWARTVKNAEKGDSDVLYPEYFIEKGAPSDVYKGTKRLQHLAISRKFPGGPISFMKRKGENDKYKGKFENLKDEKIGVVRGYQNTPEFDALMDKGFFDIDKAKNDLVNVKKLLVGRVKMIIGDPSVIRFSIANSNMSKIKKLKYLKELVSVSPLIQYNHLYYAFSKKKRNWKGKLNSVNKAIKEFEETGEMFRIIKTTNKVCGFYMDTLIPYEK